MITPTYFVSRMGTKMHEGPGKVRHQVAFSYDSYRITVVGVVLYLPPVPGKKNMFHLCENTGSAT